MRGRIAGLVIVAMLSACTPPADELAGRWEVQQIAGASLGADVDIWIEFLDGEAVRGFSGCNDFTTNAAKFESGLSFGAVVEGPGACPNEAASVDEARLLGVLPSVQRYIRNGRSLELLPAAEGSEALLRLRQVD